MDKNSSTPLYIQLRQSLQEYIADNLNPGDMIPTESEIEEMYEVSRITVRKAIDLLVAEGLVVKQQGRGTFVQEKIIQEMGSITSWTEQMRLRGYQLETRDQEIREVKPSKKLINSLKLDPNEQLICIKRVRCTDGVPIAIMFNYLRSRFVAGFLKRGLKSESLYAELENVYGIVIAKADELIQAREATEFEAAVLNIPPYSPVLHITRNSYLPDETPFEIVELVARADRYQYRISLNGRTTTRVINIGDKGGF